MNKNRPDFFEPYPKMPEVLTSEVYALKVIGYENGYEITDFELFSHDELDEIKLEIEKLFTGKGMVARYYNCDCNGDSAFHVECFTDDLEDEMPIANEWFTKTVVFGHPKKEKELQLVGDRIPITVTGHPTLQLRFVSCRVYH